MKYAKALTAAVLAGLTAVGTGLTDGGMSAQEWVAVAIAFVATGGAVFGVPNADPTADL